jgi:hypothetical protein
MGKKRSACKVLVGKPEARRPLGEPRYRWEGNIKIDFRETGWGDMDWFYLAQDRYQWAHLNTVMNFQVS